LVKLEENWLADVGFGDSFLWPLQLGAERPAEQGIDHFKISNKNNRHIVFRQRRGESWDPQYEFDLQSHELHEFNAMCRYHQTSPKSSFTQKRVCSLATDDGRVTLSNDRLTIRNGIKRSKKHIQDTGEFRQVLLDRFGIHIEDSTERLMPVNPA
jgi:N-hydroxyarylamine O-acetyltransferase